MPIRSAPMETTLLNKLDQLPVIPRWKIHLRRFDFSRYPVLSWHHGINRRNRRYTMRCDVLDDGTLEVSFTPGRGLRNARPMPRVKRF